VLVTSTDAAHSLADALDVPLGDRPTAVALPVGSRGPGSLHAQQVDAQARLERHWRDVRDYLSALLAWGGVGVVEAEEIVLLPGLDELFALIDLRGQVASGDYDTVIVDCAPTAETLKLLSLPDAVSWYVDRVLGPGRRIARALRPLARSLGSSGPVPVPDDNVFDAVEYLQDQLTGVHELLRDPGRASVRLVVNPERLVIAEAERTATTLSLFGYAVDAVVVNRVLPDEVSDPYLARWRDRQENHLATVRTAFAPIPVLTAPLLDDELVGIEGLSRLGDTVYGDRDEVAVLHGARPVSLEEDGSDHVLRIALPFATKDDLELHRRRGDLHVKVAGVRRTVPLPGILQRRDIARARLSDGWLEVRFRAVTTPAGRP